MSVLKRHSSVLIALIVAMLPLCVQGQRIVRVEVDTVACLRDTVRIGIGYDPSHEVVVRTAITHHSHPEVAFLPDGVPCSPYGCSYRSAVTFFDFDDDARISSAQDINYVRLNIEHSYIGDIYINITCPSGRKASLMNYSDNGSSSCTSTIPSDHTGWINSYNTVGVGSDFGMPYAHTGYPSCDSTVANNAPGTGWNYCWSNNTTHGYQYASGDGLIYRSGHSHSGRVDSSNVSQGRNFYHPDQNFSTLVNCPINGDWYIEVIDGWSGDNGYIFDWELSLNAALIPSGGTMTGCTVLGSQVFTVNDSTYDVTSPAGATGDTTVPYLVRIFGSDGGSRDTTVWIHFLNAFVVDIDDTLCVGDTAWVGSLPITRDTVIVDTLTSITGCDSIVNVRYTFNPTYEVSDSLAYCPKAEFLYEGIDYGGPVSFDSPHLTVGGCDSLVHVTLSVIDSAFDLHMLESEDYTEWWRDTVVSGCRPYTLYLRDTTPLEAWREWHIGGYDTVYTDSLVTHLFDTIGIFSLMLKAESENGCRDSVKIDNAVWVFPTPTADFDWDVKVPAMHNPETQFQNRSYTGPVEWPATGSALSYLWEIQSSEGGDFDTSTLVSPFYHWGEPSDNMTGEYTVRLIAYWTHPGPDTLYTVCADTLEQTVTIVNDFLQFPNLVTPNGDGQNDRWIVVNLVEEGLYTMNEVWIYNQWGTRVFHAKNMRREEDFWDPNETNSPDGTYYYRFTARSEYGIVKHNGTIEVARGGE